MKYEGLAKSDKLSKVIAKSSQYSAADIKTIKIKERFH